MSSHCPLRRTHRSPFSNRSRKSAFREEPRSIPSRRSSASTGSRRAFGSRLHLRPGIDGGFGNDLRVATINIDFIARFSLGGSGWDLIQGGGPVIAITKFDGFEGTDTSAGGSYLLGFAHDSGFFSEFRIGGGNTPTLKMGAGWRSSSDACHVADVAMW